MIKPNQILLTFADKETVDYIKLVCRRKGTDLEGYIVDNFEWDDMPECVRGEKANERITRKMCKHCDWEDRCPDAKKKKGAK